MTEPHDTPLFTKGIWIKEQQGSLTIGSLDDRESAVMVVPDDLCDRIYEVENEMIEALYGDRKQAFDPGIVDMEKMLARIEKKFAGKKLRVSFSADATTVFKADYDAIYNLVEKLVKSSLVPDSTGRLPDPFIFINASVVDTHLCIIYRDSESVSDPAALTHEIDLVKNRLGGEIDYKSTPGQKAYYDIMIPGAV